MDDFYPLLKTAIDEAKSLGLEASAERLEKHAFSAYTTSTEALGETGTAILEFLDAAGDTISISVRHKLDHCLKEIRKVWPEIITYWRIDRINRNKE